MTQSKSKPESKLEGNDACMLMHTALRKSCDTKITSCLYNLIHLVDIKPHKFDPWRFLGQLVADKVNSGEKPVAALKSSHQEFQVKFLDLVQDAREKSEAVPEDVRMWLYAISCVMHCFSKQDWEGMASYLADE